MVNLFFIATSFPEDLEKFEEWMKNKKLKVPAEYLDKFRKDFGGIPGNLNLQDMKQIQEIGKRCTKGDHKYCEHYTNVVFNEVKIYHLRMSNTGYDEFMSYIAPHVSMGHFDLQGGGIVKKIMNFFLRFLPIKRISEQELSRWRKLSTNSEKMPNIDSLYIQPIGYIEDIKTPHGIDKV